MNKIILKKSTHRNFMSYGDIPNEFTFADGIILLTAPNGSGKSAIIEVINFALFGTSYRGGTRDELRNTCNTKLVMEVSLEFMVDRGNGDVSDYRIYRSVSPSGTMKFDLEKNVDGSWIMQNKRAGYNQKDFEERILGFNEVLFRNVIALNTQESTPFIDMTAAKRRELLESIISMSTAYWKKESARRLSDATMACGIAESDISRLNAEISNLEAICNRLRSEKQANIVNLRAELDSNKAKYDGLLASIADISTKISTESQKIREYSAVLNEESSVDMQIARINSASACILRVEDAKSAVSKAQDAYNVASSRYSQERFDSETAKKDEITGRISDYNSTISSIDRDIGVKTYELNTIGSKMSTVEAHGKSLKVGVPCPTCGKPSTEEDIKTIRDGLVTQWTEFRAQKKSISAEISSLNAKRSEIVQLANDADAELKKCTEAIDAERGIYVNDVIPAKAALDSACESLVRLNAEIASAGVDPAEFSSKVAELMARKQQIADVRPLWQASYDMCGELQGTLGVYNGTKSSLELTMSRLSSEIDRLDRANADDSLAVSEQRLMDAKSELDLATKRLHEQSDLQAGYSYISKNLCSDDGMKKMLFGLFVPEFNKSVQKNLVHTGLSVSIEFDDTMSYKFITAPGLSPSYKMLSQGQHRRIGFAIAMAFRDFVAMVGNFSINLLSLDEVIDQSTDDAGMIDMMDMVRSMISDIGCALVITHRKSVIMDKFDYCVQIDNDGMYSSVGELVKL